MKLVRHGDDWVIEGPEKDRARIAYAVLDSDRLAYDLRPTSKLQGHSERDLVFV
jgi:hypothetical protein